MNKLIGGIALAGLLVIASAASQSSIGAEAADPVNTNLELSVGSSPECPNYSSGILRIQASAVGQAASECFVASLWTDNVTEMTITVTSDSSLLPNYHEEYEATPGQIDYPIYIEASGAQGLNSGTVTVTASASLLPDFDFPFANAPQKFIAPYSGSYTFEVWGAQGGRGVVKESAGGGYSIGTKILSAGTTLYVYVGGQGQAGTTAYPSPIRIGGFNGGGNGALSGTAIHGYGGGGGGGTDIRFDMTSPPTGIPTSDPRIIVAGGSGGGSGNPNGTDGWAAGAYGGGLAGGNASLYNGTSVPGGTQSTGNAPWAGQNATNEALGNSGNGGGGGGWWGGRSIDVSQGSGGGGSGYIGGVTSGSTTGGNLTFLSPSGESEKGHTGNGFARITYSG